MSSLFKRHPWRKLLALALAVALALALIFGAGHWAEQRELKAKMDTLHQATAAHVLGLRGLVEKHDFLPHASARHPDVRRLLQAPHEAALRARVNAYFADLQATTGAAALFLIDREGLTIAASNWNLPSSFVGETYRQRPYFEDAVEGRRGLFFGVGLTTGQPGLFIAEPVRAASGGSGAIAANDAHAVIGVMVVKISLDPLEQAWRHGANPVVLRDSRGVVFLSGVSEWRFHGVAPVSAADAAWIADHGQYGARRRFEVLPWTTRVRGDFPGFVLQTSVDGRRREYLALDTPLSELGWTLTVTEDMREVRLARRFALALGTLAVALLLLGVQYWRLRERRYAEQRSARLELERRVDERTRDLQQAHAFRKAMEDSLLVGMRARDREGKIIYVNPAFCAMVGYGADELLGCLPPYPYWHPDDLEQQTRDSDDALQGRAAPHGAESRIRHKDGRDVITMVYTAPLIDADGVHRGWMSSIVDITAQKQAEARQRDQELRLQRSARLASAGEMASTLAHELNQPLMALSNFAIASRALATHGDPAMLTGALDDIVEQARRASEIVRRVRAMINPQRADYATLVIGAVIGHVEALLKPELNSQGVLLRPMLDDPAVKVRGDQVLLEQVLVNLIHNAAQAMHEQPRHRRRIVLATSRVAQGVRVAVSDQGPGIAPDQLEQIFAPFFTTKPDGLGLGLNICRTIIEAHGGSMTVMNGADGGAIFSFILPIVP